MRIGDFIQQLLVINKKKKKDLSLFLGKKDRQSAYDLIKKGNNKTIQLLELEKIAEFFNISVYEFINQNDNILNEPTSIYGVKNKEDRIKQLEMKQEKLEKKIEEFAQNLPKMNNKKPKNNNINKLKKK